MNTLTLCELSDAIKLYEDIVARNPRNAEARARMEGLKAEYYRREERYHAAEIARMRVA